ncbi:hypothetical protein H2200_005211 [Cladophialophora chaetospira]|uniref:Fumarylacetoacetase-like C-terminal domain-containing protein n=1 Tax=Cladophialophora chaetospira TaxID=386627 RepID=A0AA38XBM8_9EURO|nr:hypothetical protein H2200_005211 [Cladophialophora chaetospira]
MAEKGVFDRLIRFIDNEGAHRYGDVPVDLSIAEIEGKAVSVLSGNVKDGFKKTSETKPVSKLLCPLQYAPIIPCIGLNYRHHAEEAKMTIPTHPVLFVKPSDALIGPFDDIHIHPEVQQQLDYEGELTVVIGRDGKNIAAENALDYVLGYTVGNDLSARDYQVPASVSGGQYSYAKSFDDFAPIGPCITSTSLIPEPQVLKFTTKVNGEVRQQSETADMIWSVRQIIAHLSRGTTLRAGTCIMTGTPSGVGLWMQPPKFLKNGDVIEVEFEHIGIIKNKVVFD